MTPDYLSAAYVGRERLLELQQLYHEAESWVKEWDRLPAETGAGTTHPGDDRDDK